MGMNLNNRLLVERSIHQEEFLGDGEGGGGSGEKERKERRIVK